MIMYSSTLFESNMLISLFDTECRQLYFFKSFSNTADKQRAERQRKIERNRDKKKQLDNNNIPVPAAERKPKRGRSSTDSRKPTGNIERAPKIRKVTPVNSAGPVLTTGHVSPTLSRLPTGPFASLSLGVSESVVLQANTPLPPITAFPSASARHVSSIGVIPEAHAYTDNSYMFSPIMPYTPAIQQLNSDAQYRQPMTSCHKELIEARIEFDENEATVIPHSNLQHHTDSQPRPDTAAILDGHDAASYYVTGDITPAYASSVHTRLNNYLDPDLSTITCVPTSPLSEGSSTSTGSSTIPHMRTAIGSPSGKDGDSPNTPSPVNVPAASTDYKYTLDFATVLTSGVTKNMSEDTALLLIELANSFSGTFDVDIEETLEHKPSYDEIFLHCESTIKLIVNMFSKLSTFQCFCIDDQISLLKNSIVEMIILLSVRAYDASSGGFYIRKSNGFQLMSIESLTTFHVGKELLASYREFAVEVLHTVQYDGAIMMCLISLLFFRNKKEESGMTFKHADRMEMCHQLYVKTLTNYLDVKYAGRNVTIESVMNLSSKINETCVKWKEALMECPLDEVSPLIAEMLEVASTKQN